MATFVVFDEFAAKLANKEIDIGTDTWKAILSAASPDAAADDEIADITQIAATGGYAAVTLSNVTWAETAGGSGIWEFNCDPIVFTASGANFEAARYVTIYDDTATGDPVAAYIDYGSNFTVTDGNTFTLTVGSDGILRITVT